MSVGLTRKPSASINIIVYMYHLQYVDELWFHYSQAGAILAVRVLTRPDQDPSERIYSPAYHPTRTIFMIPSSFSFSKISEPCAIPDATTHRDSHRMRY